MSSCNADPDTGLPRCQPHPVSDDQVTARREAEAAERYRTLDQRHPHATELTARLTREYGMDPDRAVRAAGIARDCGLNNEPVTGGYISILATWRAAAGSWEYTIEPHTAGRDKQEKCSS